MRGKNPVSSRKQARVSKSFARPKRELREAGGWTSLRDAIPPTSTTTPPRTPPTCCRRGQTHRSLRDALDGRERARRFLRDLAHFNSFQSPSIQFDSGKTKGLLSKAAGGRREIRAPKPCVKRGYASLHTFSEAHKFTRLPRDELWLRPQSHYRFSCWRAYIQVYRYTLSHACTRPRTQACSRAHADGTLPARPMRGESLPWGSRGNARERETQNRESERV